MGGISGNIELKRPTWRLLCAVAVSLSILFACPSIAQTYSSIGLGGISCGLWVTIRGEHDAMDAEQWLFGFLSGVGWEASSSLDPLHNIDAYGVMLWVDNYCHAHPLSKLGEAAGEFVFAHPS